MSATHNNIDTSSVEPTIQGTHLMSLKYSWSSATLAVILLLGSKRSILWNKYTTHPQTIVRTSLNQLKQLRI
jgi:hypothetical protein